MPCSCSSFPTFQIIHFHICIGTLYHSSCAYASPLLILPIWTHLLHRHFRIEMSKNRCFRNTCRKCFLHFLFLLCGVWPVQHSVCDRILPLRLFPLKISYRLSSSTGAVGVLCLLRLISILMLICLFPVDFAFCSASSCIENLLLNSLSPSSINCSWLIFVRNHTGFLPEEITFFYSSWIFSCMRYSYEHRKHILIH